jgi:CelD/BcsL family acetyltransferase involved in cellulose biosynthesis
MPVTVSSPLEPVDHVAPVVDVIDDVHAFAALRADWTGLLRNSESNNPFLTWEWLHAWWTHLSESRVLNLVTVRGTDGELIGVAPLCESRGRLPWLTQLEFLGTGWAGSDYLDVLARRGREGECIDALADWFERRPQTVRFDHIPRGAVAAQVSQQLSQAGWSRQTFRSGICPFATLAGHSWESYVDTLGSSQRTRCRRYLNTLRKKFDLRFERAESETQRQEMLSALIAFHEERWTPRGGSTAFQTAALQAFHHDVTARALNAGWLRLCALRLDDEIAAVTYCFHVNDRVYLYQHGFSRRYWQYSTGLVALGLTIRAAIEEGAAEFDMLYGDEPYKALWASNTRPLERIELFPSHISGRLQRRTADAERGMRMLARRIFPRKPCDSNVPPAGVAS